MILTATALVVGQGAFRAGPLDLALPPGSTTALIGPNGAGKSTLLRTLAGLTAPLSGSFAIEGTVAHLPAPGGATPPFAADYVVVMGRAARRGFSPVFGADDWAAAREALARVGAADLAGRRFDRLSSGQQGRVLLARTIAQDARLVLLDEPMAMLDPAGVAEVTAALRALGTSGTALVVATHDLDFAARADRVIAMGRTIECGTPDALLTTEKLTRLYETPLTDCQTCGHVSVVATSASPPTSAST